MRMTFKTVMAATMLSSAALFAGSANADTLVVDVGGINSFGGYDDPGNTILSFNIGAGSVVTDVAYDVSLQAFSPSWLSEIAVDFTDSALLAGVALTPGYMDSFSGVGSYADSASLVDLGLSFAVGADGILLLQFYDSFDDSSVAPDGLWTQGTLTFTYTSTATPGVPEPATWAMLIGGFALVGASMRRRATTVAYAA